MAKEIIIPLGKFKTGRDLPPGVYLMTVLGNSALISVIASNEEDTDYYLSETAMQCRVELFLGDILEIQSGKVKIARVSNFSLGFDDVDLKETDQTMINIRQATPSQNANAIPPLKTEQTQLTQTTQKTQASQQPSLKEQNTTQKLAFDYNVGELWNKNIIAFYSLQQDKIKRGLDYFKYGKVNNLSFSKGVVTAKIIGSHIEPYNVKIRVESAKPGNELLPSKWQVSFDCNCPDSAKPCKHIFALLYAVGEELKKHPYLLNYLRDFPANDY